MNRAWALRRGRCAGKLAPMSTYGQFCPVAQALEVVGERWTLLIIRELLCDHYRFSELLHGVPLMSRSLLAQRLRSLEAAGLVERKQRGSSNAFEYHLTAAGRELEPIVMGLGTWGQRWIRHDQRDKKDLDPVLLMWDLRRNLDVSRLPERETVVMFWFRDQPSKRSRYWLRIERPEIDLCLTNPGFPVELTVETKLRTMVEVWMGDRDAAAAVREGAIELKGTTALARSFPRWLLLSPFARTADAVADQGRAS
jgi:DNA-binding HxlR family transcriptional regulator